MGNQEKIVLSERLRGMDVDETVCYPIAKLLSVRTLACNIGLTTGRKYATRTDRQAGVITVTRTE